MKKIDLSILLEVLGITMVSIGVGMLSLPLAFITVGGFLIWATEKAN